MGMFLSMLALNPNISADQFADLAKAEADSAERLIGVFKQCLERCETPEAKASYIQACLPVLMTMIF